MALPYEKTPVYQLAEKSLVPGRSVTKVAAVQMHVTGDCAADDVLDMVDHAAKLGVKVLALPEYAFGPFGDSDRRRGRFARRSDLRACLRKVAAIAAKYRCLIALPSVERTAAGLYVHDVSYRPAGEGTSAATGRPILPPRNERGRRPAMTIPCSTRRSDGSA